MLPEVRLSMTISPEVSHRLMEDTFEGHLVRPMRTATGYELSAPDGVATAVGGLPSLLELALESEGELADRMVPALGKAIADSPSWQVDPAISVEDLSDAIGTQFDVGLVLQELCRLHPEEHSCFQLLWSRSVVGEGRYLAGHGAIGGGAQFVTAEGTQSMDAGSWLAAKTEEYFSGLDPASGMAP